MIVLNNTALGVSKSHRLTVGHTLIAVDQNRFVTTGLSADISA